MARVKSILIRLVLLILCLVFFSVPSFQYLDSYYLVGPRLVQEELRELFRLFEKEQTGGENTFILIQRIAQNLFDAGEKDKFIQFLTNYVEKNPDDRFNSYYLFLVGRHYSETNAQPLAEHYYKRILNNHPDVLILGKSVHFMCLETLVETGNDPEELIGWYKDILSRFYDKIEPGKYYYYMAKTYEHLGEWDAAFQSFANFVKYPDIIIPGDPTAHEDSRKLLDFHSSAKNWTMENLDDLIETIKWALYNKNIATLNRYKAKVNFFSKSWQQESQILSGNTLFDLGVVLRSSNVRYSDSLDIDSNTREAYLRTWGWRYRIGTWYLYFRKVHYPANPEINGRWEWAGIYFGEKF